MFKKIIFSSLLSILTYQAFAESDVLSKINKYGLRPLQETEYWKQDPNELPYEKCMIYSRRGMKKAKYNIGFGMLVFKGREMFYSSVVFCYSTKLQTAFLLPVRVDDDTFGLSFPLSIQREKTFAELKNLDGKLLSNLYGKYVGSDASISFGMHGGFSRLRHKGIKLHMKYYGQGTPDLSMDLRIVELEPDSMFFREIFTKNFLKKTDKLFQEDPKDLNLEKNLHELASIKNEDKYTELAAFWKISFLDPKSEQSIETCVEKLRKEIEHHGRKRGWYGSKIACLEPSLAPAPKVDSEWLKQLKFKKIKT